MRIWSFHPKYLDAKGLVAVWRESLLAQKVLSGTTRGYKHHPQLIRFRNQKNPVPAIGKYLYQIFLEAERRGYRFDKEKIREVSCNTKIPVSRGQIEFEWRHFIRKVKMRDENAYGRIKDIIFPKVNPLFRIRKGSREYWEKG
jgi:hypothetical protein